MLPTEWPLRANITLAELLIAPSTREVRRNCRKVRPETNRNRNMAISNILRRSAPEDLVFVFGYTSFTFVSAWFESQSRVSHLTGSETHASRRNVGTVVGAGCDECFRGRWLIRATTRGAPTAFNMTVVIAYIAACARRRASLDFSTPSRAVNFQVFFFISFYFADDARGEATAAGDAQSKTDPCEKGANPATNVVATAWQNNNNDTRTKRTENKWPPPLKAIPEHPGVVRGGVLCRTQRSALSGRFFNSTPTSRVDVFFLRGGGR